MKNSIRIIPIPALWLAFALFLITGCSTTPKGVAVGYVPPYRPIFSSQERANLTGEYIARIIQRGDEAYENENYTLAKDLYYEVILALSEPDVYVLNSYAVCLGNLGLYGNAITVFNMMLEIDPDNETTINNIAICRQFIAAQTEDQRQRELEQQRQQQENMQNLVASLNAMSNTLAGMAQSNQNSPDNNATTGSDSSASGSAGSSSSTAGRGQASGNMQRNYNTRAKAAERHFDELRNAYDGTGNYLTHPASSSKIAELENALRRSQNDLRSYREECNKKGARISASYYETARPNSH